MTVKFLTPVQLWQDFDPTATPLDISMEYNTEQDGLRVKGAYFTAVSEGEEQVRAFAEIKSATQQPKKAILCVMNAGDQAALAEGFDELLKRGFAVMTLDVSGLPDESGHATRYSDGFAYASFAAGTPDRFLATPSAKSSPVFLWAKIARRAICLLEYFYPKVKVSVMGAKTAADVAWQVAATDSRVCALVAMLGDYSEPPVTEGDTSNADSYTMSLSAKSAARLLKCPCLIATAANAHGGDVEKVTEVASQIREGNPFSLTVTPRLNAQIDAGDLLSTYKWLDRTLKGEPSPDLKLSASLQSDKLAFTLAVSGAKAQAASLFYSYNDAPAEYRHWHEVVMKKHEDGSFDAEVPVWVGDREVYAYATVSLGGGLNCATKGVDTLVTSQSPYHTSQFLLDTESDHGFYADNSAKTFVSYKSDFGVEDCPDGVPGFRGVGVLRSNILSETGRYEPAAALHISVYSKEECEVRIILLKAEETGVVPYTATCYVGADEWTRLSLDIDDFKTEELLPMKDWDGLYSIILPDTVDKYYNNLLWM